MIIILIVAVPMLILLVWFSFEFDIYKPYVQEQRYYFSPWQIIDYEEAWRYTGTNLPGSHWFLEMMDTATGKRVQKLFDEQLILGRLVGEVEPTGWLFISDANTVSRRQCKLTQTGMGMFVENLSSVNVTRLNGMPLQYPKRIMTGDYLSLGDKQYWITCLRRCA